MPLAKPCSGGPRKSSSPRAVVGFVFGFVSRLSRRASDDASRVAESSFVSFGATSLRRFTTRTGTSACLTRCSDTDPRPITRRSDQTVLAPAPRLPTDQQVRARGRGVLLQDVRDGSAAPLAPQLAISAEAVATPAALASSTNRAHAASHRACPFSPLSFRNCSSRSVETGTPS